MPGWGNSYESEKVGILGVLQKKKKPKSNNNYLFKISKLLWYIDTFYFHSDNTLTFSWVLLSKAQG